MKCEFLGLSWADSDIIMPDPFQRVSRKTRHYDLKILSVKSSQDNNGEQKGGRHVRVHDGGYPAVY